MRKSARKKWVEVLRQLRNDGPEQRRTVWKSLGKSQELPPTHILNQLLSLLELEQREDIWRAGSLALHRMSLGLRAAVRSREFGADVADDRSFRSLAQWLWHPFRKPSAVLAISDPDLRRRDEEALVDLARHLSRREFPDVEFKLLQLGVSREDLIDSRRYEAICLVGRLGLYGPKAVELWRNQQARFDFLTHEHRPPERRSKIDPVYHCIIERVGDSITHYKTVDDGKRRKDYALVQRYPVHVGSRDFLILICAGASSLGTRGAAQWACDELLRSSPAHKGLIPPPKGILPASRMEAILEVTASTTKYSWQPEPTKLVHLYVDHCVWSPKDRHWEVISPRTITLIRNRQDREILDIHFDGQPVNAHKNTITFRLLAAACEMAKADGVLDTAALMRDSTIWDDKPPSDLEELSKRIRGLIKNRYLGHSLEVTKSGTRLKGVTIIEDAPGEVSSRKSSPSVSALRRIRAGRSR